MRPGSVLSAWLPVPCVFCGAADRHAGVCDGCHADLPGLAIARCPVCGIATPGAQVCGACLHSPPAFTHTVAAADYAFPLDAAVVRLKYGRDLALVHALGVVLRDALRDAPRPDVVIPMPLSDARLRARGFNQAGELARVVADALQLTLLPAAAARIRDAPPQASLPLSGRAQNVRGVFACTRDLEGLDVAVIDDVMTTGATLDALASELRRAGARKVSCWVLARTPRPG